MRVLRFKMLRSSVSSDHLKELRKFVENDLSDEFEPLLSNSLAFQASRLNFQTTRLDPATASATPSYGANPPLYAEVFPTEAGVIGLEVIEPGQRGYVLEEMAPSRGPEDRNNSTLTLYGVGADAIGETMSHIQESLEAKFSLTFKDRFFTSKKFGEMKEEGRKSPDPPSAEEIASARLLSRGSIRKAALAVASSGGLLVSDLGKQLGDDHSSAPEIERELLGAGLVDKELVVTCSHKSAQVARAPTREALEKMARSGLKCACGKAVLDERVDEALTLTAHGRTMLDGSSWMTTLLMAELHELGIEHDRMLVEQIEGGDEMDFFADISGELALFELKDKEFSINSAYSFGSKIGIFQPDLPIIVTSAYVGNDAKDHFKRSASAQRQGTFLTQTPATSEIRYIEGIDHLRAELEELVSSVYETDAIRVLSRLFPFAAPSASSVVRGIKETHRQSESDASSSAIPPIQKQVVDEPSPDSDHDPKEAIEPVT